MAADSKSPTVMPADLQALGPEDFQVLVDAYKGELLKCHDLARRVAKLASPASTMPPATPATPDTPDLWTSPIFSDNGDFFSPDFDFLQTPLITDDNGDNMMTGMFDGDSGMSLFPEMNYVEHSIFPDKTQLAPPSLDAFDNLYTLTPESPSLHSFSPSVNPSSIYPSPRLPSKRSVLPSPAPSTASALPSQNLRSLEVEAPARRRSSATGTRKGVTPEALVPVDAPTQPRTYVTPSATSRKEVPSVFAKKRSRSTAFGEEDDEFTEPPLGPDATEKEQIEYKRRQNTVAARRSRKRKLEYQQGLEDKVERLSRERDVWKTRAIMCQDMLAANGVQFTPFQDSIED
ncbi:hypothetical protein FPV67DRAFT_1453801 [Lyophyllum atratum]|nr:hypothetical protein FPV67DRAFT_1453801 [Lyophyllum atratum]